MDLNSISMFHRVVKTGSFSKAALELAVTKSTISKKVSELEAELGATLLRRTTRSLQLTELGRQFHEQCSKALNGIRDAAEAAQASSSEPRGHLRITAPADFASAVLAPHIASFLARYPEISIEMVLSEATLDFINDNIDVAIRLGHLKDSSLRVKKLGRDVFQLCASSKYLKQSPPIKTPSDLKNHACLVFAPKPEMKTWNLKSENGRYSFEPEARFVANNVFTTLSLVTAGSGIALLPISNLQKQLNSGEVEVVLPKWSMEDAPLQLVYPKLSFTPPKVKVFTAHMEHVLKPLFT